MRLRYFNIKDFNCQETGQNLMKGSFLLLLDELRHRCGFPFIVTSGYRSPDHSIERKKAKPGTHSEGIAADIKVSNGAQRHIIIKHAMEMGFTGIGIADSFVHVDTRSTTPVVWTY